ncbi:nitrous oxide reductase accessory protein NosL [Psychroserpens sp.]|uniref:nitrous oxide reductase accessory protein NosL n=1 Tax=Psychroserpens sp. TaxID=2020870 RepID=UPI001B003313|nr:nitrous oxide reductase accessory protein NosL [Psychroserpens sp.]MBO6607394.1 nitrous oxide reductase accessory protein NosL [Psychroserpens sp.]MBO6632359.1 nitrous oxide reductase accessory protein NosL [Psychroserpens sp.]MBO6654528.1 nitrous oxide reductase accessory protein NosL [Psychroserpens sp.]MBO6681123.1 nitrous oxide reductase accessory protein NosL [Psychroserpens sp.]MBO6749920.1 nitrous oxide reductase accessory protein NosL [Psychroserpens sp.]
MNRIVYILIFILCFACSKSPEPISYGTDMCHFCKMTIVTKTHSAQLVTDKGKQYKFDAIECMVRFLEDKTGIEQKSNLLIANYNNPGFMINAKTAGYLICDEITSPMGANLSGFESMETAQNTINSETAQYFDWVGISNKLNKH